MDASKSSTAEAKHRRTRRLNVVLGAVVVFFAIVAVAQFLPDRSPTSPPPAASGTDAAGEEDAGAEEPAFVRRDADDPMAIGDVDAPVVLTEWVDMRCPFCAVYSRDTLPTLIEEYVDTGLVRIEFHDVVFFGENSEDAAVAARAAANQGRYLEYVTAVFDAAPERGHPDLPRDTLIGFAEQAGVADVDRFAADLDDPDLREAVQASTLAAQQLGVNSVPFFVAGNTAVAGAQPATVFRDFLDAALAEAE